MTTRFLSQQEFSRTCLISSAIIYTKKDLRILLRTDKKNNMFAVGISGLTVSGCRSLVVLVPHGDAAVVAGRGAVLAADRAAACGRFGRFCSWGRQWWSGESGGAGRGWRGGQRHRRYNGFTGDVVGPRSLLLRGQTVNLQLHCNWTWNKYSE